MEHAFELLKRRFRRLKFFEHPDLGFVANCLVAACVLHNMCIIVNDFEEWLEELEEEEEQNSEDYNSRNEHFSENTAKREEIFNLLDNMNLLN